jgi:formylglycine-generating enzyme required for sulfatase activity
MNKILLALIGISLVQWSFSIDPPKKKIKKLSKKSQSFIDDLVVFYEGDVTVGRSVGRLIPTSRDTALLFNNVVKRVNHTHFALSKYEVSNQDYRAFEMYVHDSVKRSELAKKDAKYLLTGSQLLDWTVPLPEESEDYQIFQTGNHTYQYEKNGESIELVISPDQEVWTKDFTYAFNEPMNNMYYWHPAYDKYPVVGVSAIQAEAYCDWYSKQFFKSLTPSQKTLFKNKSFRLPTSLEWESATKEKSDDPEAILNDKTVFAWTGGSFGIQGNYGSIVDENNFNFKYFSGDGGFHTVKVNSYTPGMNGIHNMSGNVCEWTSTEAQDTVFFRYLENELTFLPGEKLSSIEKKIRQVVPTKNDKGLTEERIQHYISSVHHDCEVLSKYKDGVYVKGGSWADPLIYAMVDKKEVYLKDHQSSRIGFRMALDMDDELLEFLD